MHSGCQRFYIVCSAHIGITPIPRFWSGHAHRYSPQHSEARFIYHIAPVQKDFVNSPSFLLVAFACHLLLSVHTEHFELPFCGYVDLLFFIVVTFYDLPRATLTDCRRGRSADISRNLRVFLIALVARLYLHPAAKRTKFYQNISNISLLLGSLLHKLILQRDAEVLHTE